MLKIVLYFCLEKFRGAQAEECYSKHKFRQIDPILLLIYLVFLLAAEPGPQLEYENIAWSSVVFFFVCSVKV